MSTQASSGWHPLWLMVGGYWLWMIWSCAGEWTNTEDYNYGWFVPPLALYFLWKRWEAGGAGEEPRVAGGAGPEGLRWLAWGLILFSLLLVWPLEVVRQTPIHWRPTLWLIGILAVGNTLAVAWLTGGWPRVRIFLIPSLFMLVGIPWPTFLESAVSLPLMQWVTTWSVGLLHLLGYPATAMGSTISLPNCTVGVEEACSGLRSLQTALMVGLAAGELARLGVRLRVFLLLVALVLAIIANQFRVLMLALAGIAQGNEGVAEMHDAAGYAVLAILLVGVGAVTAMLAKWGPARTAAVATASTPGPATDAAVADARGWRGPAWAVLGIWCVAMLGAHGWYWWRASLASPPSPALLQANEAAGYFVDEEVPAAILGVLQPDEYRYIREMSGGIPSRVIGYHFYWRPRQGNANQLYHRPDRCMPGAGWRIDGEVTRQTVRLDGRDFTFNVFPFRGPGGPALMFWGSYLNGEPAQVEFNTDVYVQTANLRQFIRTGTRVHSYEVAAWIMPYAGDSPPQAEEIEAYANRVFAPAGS